MNRLKNLLKMIQKKWYVALIAGVACLTLFAGYFSQFQPVNENTENQKPMVEYTNLPEFKSPKSLLGPQGITLGYTGKQNKIYKNEKEIKVFGLSWFGLEDDGYSPHGLWKRNLDEIIDQFVGWGFNSVRLPFCPAILENKKVGYIDLKANPDLTGMKSLDLMDEVIRRLDAKGINILLDVHNFDCTNELHPLWYSKDFSEADWLETWRVVVDRYKNVDHILGADIKNEPHKDDKTGVFATWGSGDVKTDWKIAAEKVGKMLLEINPKMLIFVQGIGDGQKDCVRQVDQHFWGGNLEPVNCYPIDTAMIPANKLVYTPHVYGPDVSKTLDAFKAKDYPNNLPKIWDEHFGYLIGKGYTIAIGEFGGKFGHDDKFGKADPRDKTWQTKFIDYLIEKNQCTFFYWSLNPDSSDTGGLLQADWKTPHTDKIENLQRLMQKCK
jgi:endoglucanase